MNAKLKVFTLSTLLFVGSFSFNGCDKATQQLIQDLTTQFALGWLGDNLGQIESDVDLTNNGTLPAKVDLTAKFPPIGDQGQYGTCVAWAVGYNLKTALEGIDQRLTTTQLADANNQFSAKDLFWSIPTTDKGPDCNGTGFESALDIMITRGIAKKSVVPYTNLGNCATQPEATWTQNANQYKIDNYRKIDFSSLKTLKEYLAEGRPIAIGARLGNNFMAWNSSDILTTDTDTYQGQHAYHAMVVVGYDDTKGPRGAFRVVNSWNTGWGDKGYIWVDYQFFISKFCFAAFVVKNKSNGSVDPKDTTVVTNGKVDLLSYQLQDIDDEASSDPRDRKFVYNVYNVGERTVKASERWNIVYLYYNAYDAKDYGIILYDYYTNEYGSYGENGTLGTNGDGVFNWFNYVDLPQGKSVAEAVSGNPDSYFVWNYKMPSTLNGYYYLVLIADGYSVVDEFDESNNYYYITDDQGEPLLISNGIISSKPKIMDDLLSNKTVKKPVKGDKSPSPTAKNSRNVNAYSPEEISQMIKVHKERGQLVQTLRKSTSATKRLVTF